MPQVLHNEIDLLQSFCVLIMMILLVICHNADLVVTERDTDVKLLMSAVF